VCYWDIWGSLSFICYANFGGNKRVYSNDQCKCNWKRASVSFEPNIRAWGGSQSLAELSMGIMLLVPNQHCLNYAHRSDAPRLFSYDRLLIDGHRTLKKDLVDQAFQPLMCTSSTSVHACLSLRSYY
jgi:hypothetical protein